MLDIYYYNSFFRGSSWVRERCVMFGFLCKSYGFRFIVKNSLLSKYKIYVYMKILKL